MLKFQKAIIRCKYEASVWDRVYGTGLSKSSPQAPVTAAITYNSSKAERC